MEWGAGRMMMRGGGKSTSSVILPHPWQGAELDMKIYIFGILIRGRPYPGRWAGQCTYVVRACGCVSFGAGRIRPGVSRLLHNGPLSAPLAEPLLSGAGAAIASRLHKLMRSSGWSFWQILAVSACAPKEMLEETTAFTTPLGPLLAPRLGHS